MRRTPSGDFEPVSWQAALAEACARMTAVQQKHGANALAVYIGNPVVHDHGAALSRAGLMAALGTRNCYSAGSQDTSPRFAASWHLYGSSFTTPIPDLERTDYFLCIGANPVVSNGSLLTAPNMRGRLRAIRARGGKVVVVDPRRSESAREADEHVAILPGGDSALLLGMLRVLLDEDLVVRGAIAAQARGFAAIDGDGALGRQEGCRLPGEGDLFEGLHCALALHLGKPIVGPLLPAAQGAGEQEGHAHHQPSGVPSRVKTRQG